MSVPSSRISPASGRSNPAIMRSNVVLPQPEGPSRVKNSPACTARLTLSTAVSGPKRRVTLRISRSAMRKWLAVARGILEHREREHHEDKRGNQEKPGDEIVAPGVLARQALHGAAQRAKAVLVEGAVHQARKLRKRRRPVRRLPAQRAQQAAPAHLLVHPAL